MSGHHHGERVAADAAVPRPAAGHGGAGAGRPGQHLLGGGAGGGAAPRGLQRHAALHLRSHPRPRHRVRRHRGRYTGGETSLLDNFYIIQNRPIIE